MTRGTRSNETLSFAQGDKPLIVMLSAAKHLATRSTVPQYCVYIMALHRDELDAATVEETLGCIFKYNDDIEAFRQGNLVALLEQADIDKQM